jgi:DNA processing protein
VLGPRASLTSLCPEFDLLDVVALSTIEGYGPATVREVLERIRSDQQSIDAAFPRVTLVAARKAARAQLEAAERLGARCIMDGDPDFPPSFRDLDIVPTHVWALGDPRILGGARSVAIVGTRDFTSYGERVTRSLGNAFARNGVVVVSGMARGIDSVAHLAALEAGGKTVAVLGTGVDVPYPAGNRALHRRICKHGAIFSEAPPGMHALPGCFPRRNRLIAALGQATIVVEAGQKSGALGTADLSDGINRPVGIIPGPIDSPVSLGTNGRLRDGGGHCIATIDDALQLVGVSEPGKATVTFETAIERTIWNALERPAANFDVLTARTNLPARMCLEAVTTLELRGLVDCAITGELRRRR